MTSAKGLPDSGSIDATFGAAGLPSVGSTPIAPPLPPPLVLPPSNLPGSKQALPATKTPVRPKAPVPSSQQATPNPKYPPSTPPAINSSPVPLVKPAQVTPTKANSQTAALPSSAVPHTALESDEIAFSIHDLYRDSPAWLTSLVVHMLVVIVLGLVYIAPKTGDVIELVASLAVNGNNTELTNSADIKTDTPPVLDEPPVNIPDGPIVNDPSMVPLSVQPTDLGTTPTDPTQEFSQPTIGDFLKGRESGSKQNLAIKFGATKGTLDAVAMALEWIARNQQKNGSWSLEKPYKNGAPYENVNAATAMAMLALQGDGNTHTKGQYQKNVAAGLKVLLRSQATNGSLHGGSSSEHQMMYTHALATIAICELYGMTHDSLLREPCEKAIKYLVTVQASEGGWRYRPGFESDMSVTGWCVMALQSARAAKLDVPNDTLRNVSRFLDSVKSDEYAFSYLPRDPPTYSMTAEGLLSRQLLGMKRNDPAMAAGIGVLLRSDDLTWEKGESGTHSVYGWYYATQVLHHYGDKQWEQWNNKMRVVLPANQIKNGPEKGSWPPENDFYGSQAGRLYQTCLCTYMLEVYWRHMPIYKEVYVPKAKPSAEKEPGDAVEMEKKESEDKNSPEPKDA